MLLNEANGVDEINTSMAIRKGILVVSSLRLALSANLRATHPSVLVGTKIVEREKAILIFAQLFKADMKHTLTSIHNQQSSCLCPSVKPFDCRCNSACVFRVGISPTASPEHHRVVERILGRSRPDRSTD